MKRLIAVLLCACLVLTGCTGGSGYQSDLVSPASNVYPEQYADLSDPELVDYLEDDVYDSLVLALDSDDYLVEEVEVSYVSQEYLEELSFNSLDNVFFGYSLDEVIEHFGDTPYVFTASDGKTVVKEFESYDDTWDQVALNVAVGTGVIVVLATVTVVAPAVGAPQAVTAVFTFATKGAVVGAAIDAPVSGAMAGIMTGLETGSVDEAIKSAALEASEGYKIGAIIGGATGALSEVVWLKEASAGGLTMSEAAIIQKESQYPIEAIRDMRNIDEYEVYKKAGLKPCTITTPQGKKTVLAGELDLNRKDPSGLSNLERMKGGKPPLDADGIPYEYHHIGQKNDGALALLTQKEHDSGGLHARQESEIDRSRFETLKKHVNRGLADLYEAAA